MFARFTFALFAAMSGASYSHARPVVVFDIDHTLLDTNTRIVAIVRDLGVEYDIPEFFTLSANDIESARLGRVRNLGLDGEKVMKVFSKDVHNRKSPFGLKFYGDPSYFIHDGLIPGAPEFVARMARELDANIIYLTGRFIEAHTEATLAQLHHWGFPGYTKSPEFIGRTRLIMKPIDYPRPTDEFKVAEFSKLAHDEPVVAVFDDASRNVNAFAKMLPEGTPIVHITRNVGRRANIDPRVEQITNYLYNQSLGEDGKRVAWRNLEQLDDILARARICAERLGEG